MIDLYLSEMSVSDRHGGGLTLQRVLGSDLDSIGTFVHIDRFAQRLEPNTNAVQRSIDIPPWLSSATARRWLGRRLSENGPKSYVGSRMHARKVAQRLLEIIPRGSRVTALVCPQGRLSIDCTHELQKHFQLEYITWLMDDHVVRYTEKGWRYPLGVRRAMRRHLEQASTVFVISPSMAEFYQQQFGVHAEVLFAPTDPVEDPIWNAPSGPDGPAKLAYFGRMDDWQGLGFCDFLEHLPPGVATIDVFTSAEAGVYLKHRFSGLTGLQVRDPIPHQDVLAKMREYDALILPLSFGERFRHLVELNIATKMSEYLASGTVILIAGPPFAAMARFLSERGAASIVTTLTNEKLLLAIKEIKDPAERRRILTAARKVSLEETSTSFMRAKWQRALSKLSPGPISRQVA